MTFAVLPYTATASGIWWVSTPTHDRTYWSIRMLRFTDRKIIEVIKLESIPFALNLSVSPDERYILLTKPDTSGTDLLLVNNFRSGACAIGEGCAPTRRPSRPLAAVTR